MKAFKVGLLVLATGLNWGWGQPAPATTPWSRTFLRETSAANARGNLGIAATNVTVLDVDQGQFQTNGYWLHLKTAAAVTNLVLRGNATTTSNLTVSGNSSTTKTPLRLEDWTSGGGTTLIVSNVDSAFDSLRLSSAGNLTVAGSFTGAGTGITNLPNADATNNGALSTNMSIALEAELDKKVIYATPPRGFDIWYAGEPARTTAAYMTGHVDVCWTNGLVERGWNTILITDGWQGGRTNGILYPDGDTFPDITNLIAHIHAAGMKAGIYTEPGPLTSWKNIGKPGTDWDYFDIDAQTFAAWGVDYVQFDVPQVGSASLKAYAVRKFSDALKRATHRPIAIYTGGWRWNDANFNSYEAGGVADVFRFVTDKTIGASGQPRLEFINAVNYLLYTNYHLRHLVTPGHWLSHDYTTCNGDSAESRRTTWGDMSIAAMMRYYCFTPVPAGPTDNWGGFGAETSTFRYSIFTNAVFLGIHDDLSPAADIVKTNADWSVWVRHLANGSKAVMYLNHTTNAGSAMYCAWTNVGWREGDWARVYDVWQHTNTLATNGFSYTPLAASAGLFLVEKDGGLLTRKDGDGLYSSGNPNGVTNGYTPDLTLAGKVTIPYQGAGNTLLAENANNYGVAIIASNSFSSSHVGLGPALSGYGGVQFVPNYNMAHSLNALWGNTNQTVINVPDTNSATSGGIQFRGTGVKIAEIMPAGAIEGFQLHRGQFRGNGAGLTNLTLNELNWATTQFNADDDVFSIKDGPLLTNILVSGGNLTNMAAYGTLTFNDANVATVATVVGATNETVLRTATIGTNGYVVATTRTNALEVRGALQVYRQYLDVNDFYIRGTSTRTVGTVSGPSDADDFVFYLNWINGANCGFGWMPPIWSTGMVWTAYYGVKDTYTEPSTNAISIRPGYFGTAAATGDRSIVYPIAYPADVNIVSTNGINTITMTNFLGDTNCLKFFHVYNSGARTNTAAWRVYRVIVDYYGSPLVGTNLWDKN